MHDMKLKEDLTELGNAKLFCEITQGNFRWLYEAKNWIVWDSNKWQLDDSGKAFREYEAILGYFSAVIAEAQGELDTLQANPDVKIKGTKVNIQAADLTKRIKDVRGWYMRSQSKNNICSSLLLAKTQPDMTITMSDIDNHAQYLGVSNGVVNIATGDLLTDEDARGLYVMQSADVDYDKDATCDEWKMMVSRLMLGDKSIVKFLQTLLGGAMLGTNSKYFTFFYGSGSNGKTTILEIVDRIMGDYAVTGDPDLFSKNTKKNREYYFAMYHGKRLLVFNEIDKEMVNLSEDLIKQTTDSGQVTARYPAGRAFRYIPQFTPIFSVNHLPNVSNDSAVWRRTVIVPFDYVVPDTEKEDDYVGRMVREHGSGILNWLLEGAREYLENSLDIPEKLKRFTNELKQETDVLATFLDEYVGEGRDVERVLASDLRNRYVTWLSENGYTRKPTIRNFTVDIRAAGYEVKKANQNKTYVFGLDALKTDTEIEGVTDLKKFMES